MNTRTTLSLLGLLCFGTCLMAQKVTYNFDQAADFSKFKSYKWVDIKGGQAPDQLIDQQIRAALDLELTKKGLSKTDSDTASLFVAYQIAVGQEQQVNSYTTGGAGWGYGSRWGGGMSTTTSTVSTINVGTLALDMYDPPAKQLIWRGTATRTLDTNAKPEKRLKNLAKATEKLLKNYPPPVKK